MSQSDTRLGADAPKPMDYGFSSSFDDLSTVAPSRPKPASKKPVTPKRAGAAKAAKKPVKKGAPKTSVTDKVAKSHGFASREAQPVVLKKRRRTHHDEPVDQLSIRGPVRILNDFIIYCEAENLSYWEGLDALLDKTSSTSK